MTHKILFICTGNYYRSRFAEIFFNQLVLEMDMDWRAVSRGIAVDQGAGNVGPISVHALKRLELCGISSDNPIRFPIQLEERDLLEADLTIALDRKEHTRLMQERFGHWVGRITYWDVPDLNITGADDALSRVERNVRALIDNLRSGS